MHCLLAPAVSVVNCLFMTWNGFLTYRLLCCLKARNAWDQTPFLRVKNFCGARGVRGCTVVSLAHAFCLPASACPLKDGATCFDEWLEDDFCKLWLLRLCQLRAFSATFELIHFCDSYALYCARRTYVRLLKLQILSVKGKCQIMEQGTTLIFDGVSKTQRRRCVC